MASDNDDMTAGEVVRISEDISGAFAATNAVGRERLMITALRATLEFTIRHDETTLSARVIVDGVDRAVLDDIAAINDYFVIRKNPVYFPETYLASGAGTTAISIVGKNNVRQEYLLEFTGRAPLHKE